MAFPCKMLKKEFLVHDIHSMQFSLSFEFVFSRVTQNLIILTQFSCILSQIAIKTVFNRPFSFSSTTFYLRCPFRFIFIILLYSSHFGVSLLDASRLCRVQSRKNANSLIPWIFILCIPQRKVPLHIEKKCASQEKKQKNNHDFNCLRDFRC